MNYKCVVCEKEIKQIEEALEKDKPWTGCYNNGVVEKIHAGYGSLLDGNVHILAICDKCLDKKTLAGITPYIGDYLYPNEDIGYIPLREDHG